MIKLYGEAAGFTTIKTGTNSSITLTLPSSGGTLARTADNVASASKVKSGSRPTSANITVAGDNSMTHYKIASACTEGKPGSDGHLLHFEWDNTGGWSSQLHIPNRSSSNVQFRGMNAGTTG